MADRLYRRAAGGGSYHPLSIHIYRPHADLGGGTGLLDFRRERLARLIALGYQDAVTHDCASEGCALPVPNPAAAVAAPRAEAEAR